ncbi:ATP-binding protein [Clostridium sp. CF012]|uniref:ATP-binding protein n=1 Tax=Clostridium sp. CF012 TaxID=2843319 RepID=UPI001C0E1E2D|nr:ATP-binding protein [Clostridium sp. CF012]MBU3146962.1 hypothetical protein [Clostridium sp. CF012]
MREFTLLEAYIEGVGIGLYLTREIISKQGGYLKVKSKKGIGSKFSVFNMHFVRSLLHCFVKINL